jgi:hypothetical protein
MIFPAVPSGADPEAFPDALPAFPSEPGFFKK